MAQLCQQRAAFIVTTVVGLQTQSTLISRPLLFHGFRCMHLLLSSRVKVVHYLYITPVCPPSSIGPPPFSICQVLLNNIFFLFFFSFFFAIITSFCLLCFLRNPHYRPSARRSNILITYSSLILDFCRRSKICLSNSPTPPVQ